MSKLGREADRHVDLQERASRPPFSTAPGRCSLVVADVGAAAVGLAGRVVDHLTGGRPDDPEQLALVLGDRQDAGPGRARSTLERRPRRAYDATSPAAALAALGARLRGAWRGSGGGGRLGLGRGLAVGPVAVGVGPAFAAAVAGWAPAVSGWTAVAARPPRRSALAAFGGSCGPASRRRGLGLGDGSAASARLAVGRRRRPRDASRRSRRGRRRLGHRDVARMSIRQPVSGGEPGVLALAPDRQREHPLGHRHVRDAVLLVDVDREDLRRRQRVGDEHAGVVVPRDDVDLLAAELGDDGLDAGAALADGRADRIEALLARRDGDLGAAAGLAGDRADLDRAVVDLGHLELEQALQEALVRPADE